MSIQPEGFPRIVPVGEAAGLIELGEELDRDINHRVYTLDGCLMNYSR